MVEPLEQLLKDVKTSNSVRDDMFNYCARRGYYKGVEREEARRQFVSDINEESPKRERMALDFVPSYLDYRAADVRLNRSVGTGVVGAAAYVAGAGFGAGLLALGGAVAMVTGGLFGAYYALKKWLR